MLGLKQDPLEEESALRTAELPLPFYTRLLILYYLLLTEAKGQFAGAISLLPPHGLGKLNSGHEVGDPDFTC